LSLRRSSLSRPSPRPSPNRSNPPSLKAPEAKAPAPKLAPVAKAPPAKPVEAPKITIKAEPAPKAAAPVSPATPAQPTAKPKEPAMTTLPTFDVPEAFKTAFADFQEKAKAAYEKSTASAADYSEFAKGNVEALVEAGKILTSGLQELGTALVADSREAFEALTGEVKSLAGAKTPTDFFQLQSDLLKKHFDKSVAFSSKQSEAVLKLASEAVAPISGRVSLAVDKIKAAA
jgi:phasin family protein